MKNFSEYKLSVALCTYNGSKYLRKQLDSILSQTYAPDEIIIVDDCSTDNTRNILSEYALANSKIKIYFNEKNLGSNLTFRKAIYLAQGDFIALCDQDDIWFNNKLEIQMFEIMQVNDPYSKPLLHFHDLRLMSDDEIVIEDSFWKLHNFNANTFRFQDLFLFNIVTGCTCIINEQLKINLLKSDMRNIIMHDYLIALIAYGFGTVLFNNSQLMLYRSHHSSVTTKIKMTYSSRIQSFIKRVNGNEYLKPNILQMDAFLSLFSNELPEIYRAESETFVSLLNTPFIKRFKYKWHDSRQKNKNS